jgi:hypothetical protein
LAIVRPAIPESFLSPVDSVVNEQCGADFTCESTMYKRIVVLF